MSGSGTETKRSLANLLNQIPMATRILLFGGIGILLVTLVLSNRWPQRQVMTPLFGDSKFSNQELQRLQLALSRSGLSGFGIRDGQLLVPSSLISKCIKVLDESDAIPRGIKPSQPPAPEISPFVSRFQQQLQQQHQKKVVVQQMLRRLAFVSDAALEIDFGAAENSRLEKSLVKCTAIIQSVENRILQQQELETVQQILMGSIVNLDRTGIVIVDQAAGIAYDHHLIGQPQTASQAAAISRLRQIQSLEQSIRRTLGDQKHLEISVICPDFRDTPDIQRVQPPAMLAGHATIPGSNGMATVTANEKTATETTNRDDRFCPLVNIRIGDPISQNQELAAAEQEQLKAEIVQKVRPLLPESAFRPDGPFPIDVEIASDDKQSAAAAPLAWFNVLSNQNNGWMIAVISSLCLALFFLGSLRRGKSSNSTDLQVEPDSTIGLSEQHLELQQRIDSLLRNNPDTAAKVIREWIQKAA